jgi:N-acetylglucosamine-6-sulfatase
MKQALLFLLLLFIISHSASSQCSLPKPSNIYAPYVSNCELQIAWSSNPEAAYYQLCYRTENDSWTVVSTGTDTSWSLVNLTANELYFFRVAAFCDSNQTSGYTAPMSLRTLTCASPEKISAENVTTHEATISWKAVCGTGLFNLRFKTTNDEFWTSVTDIPDTSYQITGLYTGLNYDYEVQSNCGADLSAWSNTQSFTTLIEVAPTIPPNILAIMVDDGRYDIYQPNGGPDWFSTPGISRIANEGVNFKVTIPATSQCAPSRATFYTGLYPHNHGCKVNGNHMIDSLPLIQQILRDNGYYTGFVGKYGQNLGDPTGFDWWAISINQNYTDAVYRINDNDTTILGHISDVYPELALQFLNSVPPGKPFALFYFHRAPHGPSVPRPEDAQLYLEDSIPFPDDFYRYTENYPSYYYASPWHEWPYDSLETDSMKLLEYQCTAGVENNVDTLLGYLESKNILDSTFVMYTSDNGFMKGEHLLHGKDIALEESIRVPMFIRYPKWFSDSTVIEDNIASNIDIAPTMLDLAGIPDTFGMDGISLHQLANGEVSRKNFMYEFGGMASVPPIRALRSLNYMYIHNYCVNMADELYNLALDPEEQYNLITDQSYAALTDSFRTILDSLQVVYTDIALNNANCTLKTSGTEKVTSDTVVANDPGAFLFNVGPDPASVLFKVNYDSMNDESYGYLQILNSLGQLVSSRKVLFYPESEFVFNCSTWTEGVYFVLIKTDSGWDSKKIVVKH